jgi:hypothetical protein
MSYCRSHFLKIGNYINILVLLPLDAYQEEALNMTSILLMILEELLWCSVVLFQNLGSCVLLCFSSDAYNRDWKIVDIEIGAAHIRWVVVIICPKKSIDM